MSILAREDDLVTTLERFHAEFVPVMFLDDRVEAEHYRALLELHNIPALLDDRAPGEVYYCDLPQAIPLLVPESMLDAASDLVVRDERQAAGAGDRARSAAEEEDADDIDDDDDDDDFDDMDDDDDDDLDDDADDLDDDDEDVGDDDE